MTVRRLTTIILLILIWVYCLVFGLAMIEEIEEVESPTFSIICQECGNEDYIIDINNVIRCSKCDSIMEVHK